MGFFPNLFQNSQTLFKGKKWAKRQEHNRYDHHRDRLLNIRPVVDTDPPKAYQILTKRLLQKQRVMGIDPHGAKPSVVTGPDTESLKDWKACRQQQQPAAQLKRLISAEELTHVLAELERSASRVLGQPPGPAQQPTLSSSQLVEQVQVLERSLTDLSPAAGAAEQPLQQWVTVRRSERLRQSEVTGSARSADSTAGAIGGSVPQLCLTKPTEAAGDFWVTSSKPQNGSPRQLAPYVTINNEKIPIVINQYSAQARQKVQDTIASQDIRASEQNRASDSSKDYQTESEPSAKKQQGGRKKVQHKKRSDLAAKQATTEKEGSGSQPTNVCSSQDKTGTTDNGQQRLQSVNPDDLMSADNPGGSKKASKKYQKGYESNNEEAKVETERKKYLKASKTIDNSETEKPEGDTNKEVKMKNRSVKTPRVEMSRANHSDTEVETSERKNKIDKLVGPHDKRTSFSDNTQPVKIFFKKKPTNPQISFVELAERSTQTIQHTQSETAASHAARKSVSQHAKAKDRTQPGRELNGRSKSEHAIQRDEGRPANRRVAKLTFAPTSGVAGSDPTLARGTCRQPAPKPAPARSETKVVPVPVPVRARTRSPSPAVRAASEAQRRAASPVRQTAAARDPRGPSPSGAAARRAPPTPRASQRSPRSAQAGRAVTLATPVVLPAARPASRSKAAARPRPAEPVRRRLPRLRGKVKEPAGRLSRGNAANIITTPGDSAPERRTTQASCAMCVGDQQPQSRTERVRRVIHRVTAVISPDSSPPASPSQSPPPASGRRHRQLLTRIDALAAPRRRYTEQADNQVRSARPIWRQQQQPPPPPSELYQRAMRGAACRSCNIVRTPSPLCSNPFAYMDIEADGRPLGRLTILLRADLAPRTVENFRSLCTGEYGFGYKGTLFHRVIPRFVCQGGDVTFGGRNKQAPLSIYDRLFEDESFEMNHSEPGVVSMVNNGPNTNGTQFFICAAKITWLDGRNVAFGLVTDGLQVLRKIEALGTSQGVPLKRIVVHKCGQIVND